MAARAVVLCGVLLALTVPPAWASDAIEAVSSASGTENVTLRGLVTNGSRPVHFEPKIDAGMSDDNRERLLGSFQIAIDRVQDVPQCREMFTELGADALETITRVYFTPIGIYGARANICNGTVAYTLVGGGPTTWICHEFSRMTDAQAAKIIIHEALHHAGLGEWPRDPGGMRSAAINRMVAKRCNL